MLIRDGKPAPKASRGSPRRIRPLADQRSEVSGQRVAKWETEDGGQSAEPGAGISELRAGRSEDSDQKSEVRGRGAKIVPLFLRKMEAFALFRGVIK